MKLVAESDCAKQEGTLDVSTVVWACRFGSRGDDDIAKRAVSGFNFRRNNSIQQQLGAGTLHFVVLP